MGLQEDIHQWNIDALNIIRASGAKITPAQEAAIGAAFYGISQNARTPGAWQATSDAHQIVWNNWLQALGHEPSQAFAQQMATHMTEIGKAVSGGGGGVFSKLAGTLGGAASGLAHGVSAAAQVTGKAFTDVTNSQAWKIVAMGVGTVGNLALPGIASGVSAAMLTASKIGQAATSKDALIAAGRDLLPTDAAKTGFDIGTGVAIHGAGMSPQNLQAVREKLPAPVQAGFDSALALHAGRITAKHPAPPNLPPQARAAYYASRGLVKVGAPRSMRKTVMANVATTPTAKLGVRAAVRAKAPVEREMSYLEWAFRKVRDKLVGKTSTHMAIHGEYPS